ncbi:MAG: GMC family oxidoreductase [Rhodothermales bacterium]
MRQEMPTYANTQEVDFVIVGSGAAGGVMAMELARAGFDVVVMEQGPFVDQTTFIDHDDFAQFIDLKYWGGAKGEHVQTFRASPDEEAQAVGFPAAIYGRLVGGSSVFFAANYWRFHEIDFKERSVLGPIAGTNFADWPLTYADLEPYYTRVDWEIGVSGGSGPFDPPRSKPYPLPPMPVKSSGVLFERGARALGWHPQPSPVAILSKTHNGRAACTHCGHCWGMGCEMGAKSSSLAAAIPVALQTGKCEVRAESTVMRIDTNDQNRVHQIVYLDRDGVEHAQKTKAVIVSANGAETPRLLFLSASSQHPDGLSNGSGMVGKNLMFNGAPICNGVFEQPLNEYKSIQSTRMLIDFYDTDPNRGFYGGGGLDARFFPSSPILSAAGVIPGSMSPDTPGWGQGFKDALAHDYIRTMTIMGHTTSLPLETNNITLDPEARDKWGRPALRVTYKDHPDDLAAMQFMIDRAKEVFEAAGATKVWAPDIVPQTVGAHLLGTCRMGDNPETSVVDKYHRSHEVDNLFICDGSSLVTSGRGQPTMTIQALAFRAAEHIAEFARKGEI